MEGLTYHGSSVSDVHLELSQLQTKPKSLISALRSQWVIGRKSVDNCLWIEHYLQGVLICKNFLCMSL